MDEHEIEDEDCLTFRVLPSGETTLQWAPDHALDEVLSWLEIAVEAVKTEIREHGDGNA